jgi:hypothetical protein
VGGSADAYAQEGVLTTFFRARDGRQVLDSWAKRLDSYRTADITRIRWLADAEDRQRVRPLGVRNSRPAVRQNGSGPGWG